MKTKSKHPTPDFVVVGIGFSAGGWPALLKLFEKMPAKSGMAFVAIVHLSPKHKSSADALLQRVTPMPVKQVNKAMLIEPNTVYVIPPNKLIRMYDGHLSVQDYDRQPGAQVSIDVFFRTLAEAHKNRAIAVILSGSGSDGAVGIASIKEQGGVTISQHPSEAEFDSMPLASIATQGSI